MTSETKFPTTGIRFTFFRIRVRIVIIRASPTVTPSAQAIPPIKLLKKILLCDMFTCSYFSIYSYYSPNSPEISCMAFKTISINSINGIANSFSHIIICARFAPLAKDGSLKRFMIKSLFTKSNFLSG